jgi:predicted ATPase
MASELIQQVQQALNRLGDPAYLEVHPLAASAPPETAGGSPGARLRTWLIGAIERLKPADGSEGTAYRLMERRYVAGRSVVRVYQDLGLSETEYYRQHRRALAALAALIGEERPARVEAADETPAADEEMAPAAPPARARTNLPHRPTSFVGRDAEIAACGGHLGGSPLVTVVGPPGIGKTRLALEIASRRIDEYPDGAWLVELAALTEPALVPHAVAEVLGARGERGQPILDALAAHLRPRRLLLVLDNCEHLVEACAEVVGRVVGECPSVRVLATSREQLRAGAETVYRLAPLAPPPEGSVVSVNDLARNAAGQLFLNRARAADPGFAVTPSEASAVARICRRLDGIALAIELAAARVGSLPLAEIESRLDDRFRLLAGGRRAALPRQQTLGALIDFSHDLLSPPERALLRRLAVFAGPFELAAAEEVCAGGEVPAEDVIDLLARLVDRSLVLFDRPGGRYRLLETIRAYAQERLTEAGEADAVRRCLRDRLLATVDAAEPHLTRGGGDRARWFDRLTRELDDLRAALRWCVESDPETGLRLALGLWRFWWGDVHQSEGVRWFSEVLARAEPTSPSRPRALMAASFLARVGGQGASARALAEASLPLLEAAGDSAGAGLALHNLGMIALERGDRGRAEELLTRSLALSREAGDDASVGMTLRDLGGLAIERGDHTGGAALLEESLVVLRGLRDLVGVSQTLAYLGDVTAARGQTSRAGELFREGLDAARAARYGWGEAFNTLLLRHSLHLAGDLVGARDSSQEALGLVRQLGAGRNVARMLRNLGDLERAYGDHAAARSLYEESIVVARGAVPETQLATAAIAELARRGGDVGGAAALVREALRPLPCVGYAPPVARCLAVAAAVQIDAGAADVGVRLAAAARAVDALLIGRLCPDERAAQDDVLARARRALGDRGFEEIWREGAVTALADAVRLAVGAAVQPG